MNTAGHTAQPSRTRSLPSRLTATWADVRHAQLRLVQLQRPMRRGPLG